MVDGPIKHYHNHKTVKYQYKDNTREQKECFPSKLPIYFLRTKRVRMGEVN